MRHVDRRVVRMCRWLGDARIVPLGTEERPKGGRGK